MNRHDDSAPDRLRRMAASDELSVGRGRAEQISSRALARALSRSPRRRLVAAIAGTAFGVVAVAAVGAVADNAVPGEALYAVDRAYETVGNVIGGDADRTEETLSEVQELLVRGDRVRAIAHITTELPGHIAAEPAVAESAPAQDVQAQDVQAQDVQAQDVQAQDVPSQVIAAAAPTAEAPVVDDTIDPLRLAVEQAIRAYADSSDSEALTEAVDSVVKIAAQEADEPVGDEETTSEEPVVLDGTDAAETTTTPEPDPDEEVAEEEGAVASDTTTTTVPDDSEGEPAPGEEDDPTGADQGGGQGNSGNNGDPEEEDPIFLPIP